jgi:hypothetical protein
MLWCGANTDAKNRFPLPVQRGWREEQVYTLLAGLLAGIVIASVINVVRRRSILHYATGGVLGAILGSGAGAVLAVMLSVFQPTATWDHDTAKLAAMRSSVEPQGVFFLGGGYVQGQLVYHVLLKKGDNGFSPYFAAASATTLIVEDGNLHDEGVMVIRITDKDPHSAWASWTLPDERQARYTYEFRVPKGTVRNNFSVQ